MEIYADLKFGISLEHLSGSFISFNGGLHMKRDKSACVTVQEGDLKIEISGKPDGDWFTSQELLLRSILTLLDSLDFNELNDDDFRISDKYFITRKRLCVIKNLT